MLEWPLSEIAVVRWPFSELPLVLRWVNQHSVARAFAVKRINYEAATVVFDDVDEPTATANFRETPLDNLSIGFGRRPDIDHFSHYRPSLPFLTANVQSLAVPGRLVTSNAMHCQTDPACVTKLPRDYDICFVQVPRYSIDF